MSKPNFSEKKKTHCHFVHHKSHINYPENEVQILKSGLRSMMQISEVLNAGWTVFCLQQIKRFSFCPSIRDNSVVQPSHL